MSKSELMLAGLIKNVAFILYLFKIGIIIVKHSSNPSSNVKTNLGLLINTSFNVRGEPIVCSPEDAYNCFMNTEIDYLVIENFIFDKKEQLVVSNNITFEQD